MGRFLSRWHRYRRHAQQQQTLQAAVINGSTALAIFATGVDGVISLFNSGAEAMLGYRAEELLGLKTPAIFHDDEEVREQGRALEYEFGECVSGFDVFARLAQLPEQESKAWVYIRKNGTRLRVNLSLSVLRDAQGQIIGYMGVANDISAYFALEEALSISQLSFLNAFATAAHGMAIVAPDGRWRDANISLCEMVGYSHDELLATDFQGITHPDDLAEDMAYVQRCLAGTLSSYKLEKRYIHRDGHIVYALISVSLVRDRDQEPLYFISHVQDLSLRHAAKQRLREREQQLQTIVDAVVDAIITINAKGEIEHINHAAETLFGYTEPMVQGRPASLLLPDEQPMGFAWVAESQSPATALPEVEGRRADGSRFWMEVRLAPLAHASEPMQIAVVRNITERRRVERMKEEFISTVSHELRTPLTAITGSLDLLSTGVMGTLNGEQAQLLSMAQRNSQRLSFLINDLLDMDRLVSGSIDVDIQAHALSPIVIESLNLNASYAAQFGVRYQLHGQCADEVMVDAHRLHQVLANFLSNAAKFSPENAIVDVLIEDGGSSVRISVLDNGAGIPEAKWSQLFAKFSQLDSSDTRQRSGTGLGLAITKALAECMHAHVGYAPRHPQGSVFYIDLLKKPKQPAGTT